MGQRAAIYARVSTADQCCERQIAELNRVPCDVMHALLAKMRSPQCDGDAALNIAEWMAARLDGTKPDETATEEMER